MSFAVGEAFVTIRPNTSLFAAQAQKGVAPVIKKLAGLAVAGAVIKGVAKASIDFESAFAGVRKTVDASESEFATLRQGIRDMAKELPASTTEISKVAEAAGQLGIKKENILSFTRTMIDLGETTNLTSDEAATALARLANVMGTSQANFDRLGSTVVDLGNKGASTEAEIVHLGQRLASAGKIVGLAEHEVLAFAEALSSVGIEAEAGGTAFSKVFTELANAASKGGKELKGFAQVAGQSTASFQKLFKADPSEAIIRFVEGLGRIKKEGGNVFKVLDDLGIKEIRMRNALLSAANAGGLMRQSLKTGAAAWKENTALTEEARKRYETTAAKLKVLRNKIQDLAISIGDWLVPKLLTMLNFFQNLSPAGQKVAKIIGAMAAALGVLIIATKTYTAVQAALNVVMTANPIGLFIVALAGLAAAFAMAWNSSEKFRRIVVSGMKFLVDKTLLPLELLAKGLAAAFGWIPGLGPKLKGAAKAIEGFRKGTKEKLDDLAEKKIKIKVDLDGPKRVEDGVKKVGGSLGTLPKEKPINVHIPPKKIGELGVAVGKVNQTTSGVIDLRPTHVGIPLPEIGRIAKDKFTINYLTGQIILHRQINVGIPAPQIKKHEHNVAGINILTNKIVTKRFVGVTLKPPSGKNVTDVRASIQKAFGGIQVQARINLQGGGRVTIQGSSPNIQGGKKGSSSQPAQIYGRPKQARAGGGPVKAGTLYRVNELGEEWFQPAMGGALLSASKTRKAEQQSSTEANRKSGPTYVTNFYGVQAMTEAGLRQHQKKMELLYG